jgi:hypothetical protein
VQLRGYACEIGIASLLARLIGVMRTLLLVVRRFAPRAIADRRLAPRFEALDRSVI